MASQALLDVYMNSNDPAIIQARAASDGKVSIRAIFPPSQQTTQFTSEFNDRAPGDTRTRSKPLEQNTSFTQDALNFYVRKVKDYSDSLIFKINYNAFQPDSWYVNQRKTTPGVIFGSITPSISR
jgi:hypothetical protein